MQCSFRVLCVRVRLAFSLEGAPAEDETYENSAEQATACRALTVHTRRPLVVGLMRAFHGKPEALEKVKALARDHSTVQHLE